MQKIKIVIDVTFANEWQEKLHKKNIEDLLSLIKSNMTTGLLSAPTSKHKDNKFDYQIIDQNE